MRTFLVIGHSQAPDPEGILLDDLPGAGGRWDVLARCVGAALLVSNGIRQDSEIVLHLTRARRNLRFVGALIRNLNPDERSTAALAKKALGAVTVGDHEEQPHPGVFVGKGDLAPTIQRYASGRSVVWLDEEGQASDEPWPGDALYLLSDQRDPTAEEARILADVASRRLSLGSVALHADHAIVRAHGRIDAG